MVAHGSGPRAGRGVYSGGNDRFWDWVARQSGGSFDLLKIVSSYNPETDARVPEDRKAKLKALYPFRHENRFATLGIINEPCFDQATEAHAIRYGLWLDHHQPNCAADPFEDADKYPGVPRGARGHDIPIGSFYGAPSGVIGLRLFPNPDFDKAAARRWDPVRYYTDPAYYSSPDLVRPYRVGMSCSFCHVGFHPEHVPPDLENPGWENLSSVGAQALRMERVALLPQDRSSFAWQLLHAARPGTIDTSLAATDHAFNPRAPSGLWGMPARIRLARAWGEEKLGGGALLNHQISHYVAAGPLVGLFEAPATVWAPRLGVAAMDSSGALAGITRWFLNPGMFSEEALYHFNPITGGKRQTPLGLDVLRKNSDYWPFTEQMSADVVRFLMDTGSPPHPPQAADGGAADAAGAARGKLVFADRCAACHSSKFPLSTGRGRPRCLFGQLSRLLESLLGLDADWRVPAGDGEDRLCPGFSARQRSFQRSAGAAASGWNECMHGARR